MTAVMLDRRIDLDIAIATPEALIEGDWTVPNDPKGTIILTNGTGANRRYDRNREVARLLNSAGFATLLLDVLSEDEEREDALTGAFQLDVKLQADRLVSAAEWVRDSEIGALPIGILASGVASALINTIVSRGGRPDLAAIDLHRLTTPTLLITGSRDARIFELNRWALRRMKGEGRIAVVPGASHLFEEPGALQQMCSLAIRWFYTRLRKPLLAVSHSGFEAVQMFSARAN
jgi:alpha-beta hydrolase superfamily lysophospholipase